MPCASLRSDWPGLRWWNTRYRKLNVWNSAPSWKTRPVPKAEFESRSVLRLRKIPLFSSDRSIVLRVIYPEEELKCTLEVREYSGVTVGDTSPPPPPEILETLEVLLYLRWNGWRPAPHILLGPPTPKIGCSYASERMSVSYTHLTLPTNREV